jgi:transmembrane sensor
MASANEIETAAADWFARRDRGDWQDQDQAAFEAWLDSGIAHRVAFIRMEAAWNQAERLRALGAGIESTTVPEPGGWHFSPFFHRPDSAADADETRESRPTLRWTIAAAASIALVCAGTAGWYMDFGSLTKYHTPVGGLATVPLTDGSVVTLNTNSEIAVALTDRGRTVKLPHGEAFFEVAKDARRPFVVEADGKRVVAVGTKFSVLNEDHAVRVAVTEGHVRLEGNNSHDSRSANLQPGDIARTDHDNVLIQHKAPELVEAEDLSWRGGYLVFHEKPLSEVFDEFNRYNVEKTVVTDPGLAAIKIGGSFRATNVHAFLRLLEDGFPVRAVKRGEQIVLERN